MRSTPSSTRNTLRGSSRFVSFSQVVSPVRSLPLKSLTVSFGATGSARRSTTAPRISAARRERRMAGASSRGAERPDLDGAGHVGGGEPAAVGGERDGVDPVLELPAARLAQLLDELAVGGAPDPDDGVAAAGGEVLAVGVEDDVGSAVEVSRRQLADLLARRRVEQEHLAVQPIDLAAARDREQLAVGRVRRRGEV